MSSSFDEEEFLRNVAKKDRIDYMRENYISKNNNDDVSELRNKGIRPKGILRNNNMGVRDKQCVNNVQKPTISVSPRTPAGRGRSDVNSPNVHPHINVGYSGNRPGTHHNENIGDTTYVPSTENRTFFNQPNSGGENNWTHLVRIIYKIYIKVY